MKTRTSTSNLSSDDDISNTRDCDTFQRNDSTTDANEYVKASQQKPRKTFLHLRNRRKSNKEKPRRLGFGNEEAALNANLAEVFEKNTDNSNLNNNSSLIRKAGDKKGRNLDLVLRRMLKAKKENEKQLDSCKDEIRSETTVIKPVSENRSVKPTLALRPKGIDKANERRNSSISESSIGMIDVQLSSANHLPASGRIGNSPGSSVVQRRHHDSPTRDVSNYSCGSGSSEDSPVTNPASDSEEHCVKPFVNSSSVSVADCPQDRKNDNMSPIIKQEPVSAIDSRLAMYHNNGPADTHSPSSYGSQPSPIQRSPSPSSPGGRSAGVLPSPPGLILNPAGAPHLSPAASAALLMNGGVSSYLPTMVPHSSPLGYSRHSPGGHSPHSMMSSIQYGDEIGRNPGVTAAAMAASGIGLPTLVPAMSAIPQNGPPPMFHMGENGLLPRSSYTDPSSVYAPQRRNENDNRGPKVSPNAPGGPNPPRGIIGQKEAAAASEGRSGNGNRRGGNNVDEKCPYKRPPHTYPALIASAILDSPGNLITLRGIYDYIMNNFPYYKFGHDKSAWQNSIRHNLSLNQCFVKVPRYENAAKSNYWTMTREGFEEFGNENSFKRRRRRGATLAPISAYKNKKYANNDGNTANRAGKQRNNQSEHNSMTNGGSKNPLMNFMGWGGRSRTPEPGVGYNGGQHELAKGMKRACSPGSRVSGSGTAKHPRMVVLKQGEGPAIEGLSGRSDHPQRPNSLSSVEEMQGNLNSFSKSLSAGTDNRSGSNRSPRRNQGRNSPLNSLKPSSQQQQWMMAAAAAQKNLGLLPPGLIASLTSTPPALVPPAMSSSESYPIKSHGSSAIDAQAKVSALGPLASGSAPVMLENIQIGTQVPLFFDGGSAPTWSFLCRFCEYKTVDETPLLLEQHCRLVHHMDLTNAKAKAVAAAAVAGNQRDSEGVSTSPITGQDQTGSLLSLQSMVSGFSPSMIAAAASYSNAQNLIAAAQAAGINLPGSVPHPSSMSNPVTSTPSYFTDPLMRSLAQMGTGTADQSPLKGDVLQRQQIAALNSALQQAAMTGVAGASMPQEQMRQLLYQQLLMQSPYFPSNTGLAAAMPRQIPVSRSDMSPLAQFWQYQQKMLEMSSQGAGDKAPGNEEGEKNEPRSKLSPSNVSSRKSPNRNRKGSSSSTASGQEASHSSASEENEKHTDIHGWKQCQDCDFTAKGSHGLDLHFRKAHAQNVRSDPEETRSTEEIVPANQATGTGDHLTRKQRETNDEETGTRASSNALDLSGIKSNDMMHIASSTFNSSSTQTETGENEYPADRRSCEHCDVTFGDDTMHALHMSCHDRNDPFKCTICGQACHEKYYFNVHLLRGLHQPTAKDKKQSRDECEVSDVKFGRRHSNTSEKSFTSTCSEGKNTTCGAGKNLPNRSPSSVSLPEVTSLQNGDITMHDDVSA